MLTERVIRDAKADGKTRIIWDATIKGLGLRISTKGTKAYVLSYRIDGRKRIATLARASEVSLKEIRKIAGDKLLNLRVEGIDPMANREETDQARDPTVADGLDRFFNEYAPERIKMGQLKNSTFYDYRQQANKYLRPSLGKLKIADVERSDVEKAVGDISGTIRNRVLTLTSRLFKEFERWDYRPPNSNPTYGIMRAREEARDRVLLPSELAELSKSLKKFEQQYPVSVSAIKLIALTGLKVSEVLGIQWSHIDFETGRLVLPTTKTGRRTHDLPEPALAILEGLPRFNRCPWAFTNNRRKATVYRTVRKHFIEIVADAGIENVRLHDLRRGYMTAAAAGVGAHVLRDLLGHKSTKTADRYIRSVGEPVREARAETTGTIAAMMEGDEG